MGWRDWLQNVWETLSGVAGKEVGTVIAAAVVALCGVLFTWLIRSARWLIDYHRRLNRALRDVGRSKDGEWLREGDGLWLAEPISPPSVRLKPGLSPKVLVVANAKGGVGKTTVAANLAARWAELAASSGENPILLIDLDFQGTLSSMSIYGDRTWLPENGRDSDSTYLISGDFGADRIASVQKCASSIGLAANPHDAQVRKHSWLRLVTSNYDLAQAESRLMVEWLIGNRKSDIRFTLRKLLWSDAVASSFSAIIVDCPPRIYDWSSSGFCGSDASPNPNETRFCFSRSRNLIFETDRAATECGHLLG
jgi:chromosome partitioning protein